MYVGWCLCKEPGKLRFRATNVRSGLVRTSKPGAGLGLRWYESSSERLTSAVEETEEGIE